MYLWYDLREHHSREDTPDSSGHRHDHGIYRLRGVGVYTRPEAHGLIINPEDNLVWFL